MSAYVEEILIVAVLFVVLFGGAYLAACAGAERWLSLKEFIGVKK